MLPKLIINGSSVRDYAYQWINGGCLLHQWASGGRGIDQEVIDFAQAELNKIRTAIETPEGRKRTGWTKKDLNQFARLVRYLRDNIGAEPETYIPDQWL